MARKIRCRSVTRCNLCGGPMDTLDRYANIRFNGRLGYGSRFDGEKMNLRLCIDCMDALIKSCAIDPIVEEARR